MTNENEKVLIARLHYKRPDERETQKYTRVDVEVVVEDEREWLFSYEDGTIPANNRKMYARLQALGVIEEKARELEREVTKESESHNKAITDFNVAHAIRKPWNWNSTKDGPWLKGNFEIDSWGNIEIRTPYAGGRGVETHELRKALAIEWIQRQGVGDFDMSCSLEYPQDECSRISERARDKARTLIEIER